MVDSSHSQVGGFDPYSPQLGDWRTATSFWVVAMNGEPLKEPLAGHQMTSFADDQGDVSFHTPSAAALHLNAAWKAARRADSGKPAIRWAVANPSFATVGMAQRGQRQVQADSVGVLFDYFEDTMLCAMSSFAAIEAFCNATLVERCPTGVQVNRKGVLSTIAAEEAERQVSTDEKLKRLVPEALGLPTPAGKAVWQKYVRLKAIRDSVTHFKRRDQARHADASSEPTALHDLLSLEPFELPEIAIDVVRYFHKDLPPRWLVSPVWRRGAAQDG